MTKYESMLRGGPPGSEARGMVFGSLMSLAVVLMSWGVITAVGHNVWLLNVPTRELIWVVPAALVATLRKQPALRNGLLIALVMTVLGSFVLGPLLGAIAATVISFVVKGIDLARAKRSPLADLRRRRRPGVRPAPSSGTPEQPVTSQPHDAAE